MSCPNNNLCGFVRHSAVNRDLVHMQQSELVETFNKMILALLDKHVLTRSDYQTNTSQKLWSLVRLWMLTKGRQTFMMRLECKFKLILQKLAVKIGHRPQDEYRKTLRQKRKSTYWQTRIASERANPQFLGLVQEVETPREGSMLI